VHDLDELLAGLDALELKNADGLLRHGIRELASEREIHVGLQQDASNFLEAFFDVGLGQDALSAKLREDVAEFV
jgi:hypothetical protein